MPGVTVISMDNYNDASKLVDSNFDGKHFALPHQVYVLLGHSSGAECFRSRFLYNQLLSELKSGPKSCHGYVELVLCKAMQSLQG
jgi:hypothetical protein